MCNVPLVRLLFSGLKLCITQELEWLDLAVLKGLPVLGISVKFKHFCKENQQCKKGEDWDRSDSYCEDELSVSPHCFVTIAEQVNSDFRCLWVFDCILTGQGGKSFCRADWC